MVRQAHHDRLYITILYLVRWVSCRAWLAAQIHHAEITIGAYARRNPPNVIDLDMVDYDARKYFTYL